MKKLAVFLLTGLTCASMLFGCGSKNDTVETVPVAEVQEALPLLLKQNLRRKQQPLRRMFLRKKAW